MSTFKCKMCGGTLEFQAGSTVAECEYCGAKQTLPKLDDEKRANLYDRANHFRRSNEFDKASAIYEQILTEDNTDAEAYWSLVLCRYGIEYVEDPLSHRRVPTVHRAQFTSIFDDDNYKSALKNADTYQRVIYEEEAKAINEIQKGILAISQREEPFDVFICYKETDDSGKRTSDSVLAQDLYYQLKQEGFKVFFARITLEDKLGTAYEPYIFAALNSAKVMVVLGTKPEYFNAVWVKNEWSRFLSLIKNGEKKILIPAYKDMDPYNLPKEFSHLQAQDMSKLGFMQDLIRGIKKILGWDKKSTTPTITERVVIQGDGHVQDTAPLLRRAFLFLEDGEFDSADEYAEKVLDINPECAEAYVVKLLIELCLKKPTDLAQCKNPISDSHNYQKAVRFATPEYREVIEGYNNAIIKRIDTACKEEVYARGVELMRLHRYDEAVQYFKKISNYKDATAKIDDCEKLKETERCTELYEKATQLFNAGQFDEAANLFESIKEYKDSKVKANLCEERKEIARKDAIYSQAMSRVGSQNADDSSIKRSIEELQTISGYKDVDEKIRSLNARLEKWYEDKRKAEEAARIKAEEERRTREREAELRRIKAEKTKKKVKKIAKIGVPSVAAVVVLLVLLFTLVIPLVRYNTADKLVDEGKYDDAMKIYSDLGNFLESKQRIMLLTGIEKVVDDKFEDGVKTILSAGVPVKITYGMGGGDFSGTKYLNIQTDVDYDRVAHLGIFAISNALPFSVDTTANVAQTTEFTYNSSADFSGLQTPGRSGYRFVQWQLDAYSYRVDGIFELKLNAVWSEKEYTIEYALNGGSVATQNPVEYGIEDDSFTLVNPTRTGYTFIGWTGTDLDEPTLSVTIKNGSVGNRSYVANWRANTYTINLDANGGVVSSTTVTAVYDQSYVLPEPEWSGHIFSGWYYGKEKITNGVWTRTSNIELIAKWDIVEYDIDYDMNGGTNSTLNPTKYTVEDEVTLVAPTKTGYSFKGWTYDGQTTPLLNVTISVGTIGNKKYTANWKANDYTLTFDANGGSVSPKSKTVTYDASFTLPTPSRSGYSFVGWFNGGVRYNGGIWKKTSDLSLTAQWNPIHYSVSYLLNGGINHSSNPSNYTILDSFTLNEPTKEGYTFLGWTYSGQTTPTKSVAVPAGTIGNLSYTANWKANEYTVTLEANGGSVSPTSKKVTYDAEYTLPTPTKIGYTFVGWYYQNRLFSSGIWPIANDITLTAKWTPRTDITYVVKHYLQNANDDGYTLDATQNLTGTADSIVTPSVKSYTHFVSPSAKTVTINADGTLVVEYYYDRVTYDLFYVTNGGSSIEKQTYKYEQTLAIAIPQRVGYTFGGWFVDKALSNAYSATATLNADVTIYAYWAEENKPTDFTYSGTSAIAISAYNGTSTTMWVPAYIGGVQVTKIVAAAFKNQTTLTKIVIPDTVTSIGSGAFNGCVSIEDITLPFVGGGIDSTSSLTYAFGTVPATLRNIVITVDTTIPASAFSGLSNIESITIPNDTTAIGESAFKDCESLKRLNSTTDGVFNVPQNVTAINEYTFYGCKELTTLVLGDEITSIGDYAFAGCSLLSKFNSENENELIIPNGAETIGEYAFNDVLLVTKVVVADSVTSIGAGAFNGCVSIENITLPFVGGGIDSTSSLAYAFGTVPASLRNIVITVDTTIPASAFSGLSNVESIIIPNNTTTIGESAFKDCRVLKRINSVNDGEFNIPQSITEINNYSFYGCAALTTVTLGHDVVNIGRGAFAGCSLLNKFNSNNENELIIPNSVKIIGQYAFKDVLLVKKVLVSDMVTSMGAGTFYGCIAMEDITLPFIGSDVNSTSKFTYAFETVPTTLRNIVITIDTTIPASAFSGWSNIESITIPSNTTIIGESAFKDCVALKRVNSINDGEFNIPKTITEISKYTFFGCMELARLTLGDGVEIIGEYAFAGCSLLSQFNSEKENELIIPNGVATIGEYAFKDVLLVTKVVVADSVINIGVGAFKGCVAIEDMTLPFVGASFTAEYSYGVFGYIFDWSTYTVYRAHNTDQESFSDTNRKYNTEYYYTTYVAGKNPANAVWQWSGKDKYYVGGYYTNLYYGHYYYIPTSIKNVTITVQTDIPVAAFNNCNFIETINLPKTVETNGSIGDYAFQNCNATVYYGITPTTSAVWNGSKIATSYNSGTGTEDDPYVIFDGSQLAFFIKCINEGENYDGVYFILGSNINLGGYTIPMAGANAENAFAGVLDGNGFVIKNLKVSANGNVNGLFGYLKGTLKNIRIYEYSFSAAVKSSEVTYSGALVGYVMDGAVVDSCSVVGKAVITSTGSANAFGSGFVGCNFGIIRNCISNVVTTMTGDYTIYVGGLVASNCGCIYDSYSSADVTGTSNNFMAYVGGFAGQNTATIHGSFAYGNVTANGSSLTYSRNGGFVAVNSGSLEECFRYKGQVLIRYNEASSYCVEATECELSDIIGYCRENWPTSVWDFTSQLPKHI